MALAELPFEVSAPRQRWSADAPLTVATHVEDLLATIGDRPTATLVGESWGAMLALAFAAAHPARVSALALVGCGTFDSVSRARMQQTLDERITPALRAQLARLPEEVADESQRFLRVHALFSRLYDYAPVDDPSGRVAEFDPKGHRESWHDMLRLQEAGVYPARFTAIRCPVLMLHGTYDPHPGSMIRECLKAHIPQLEYVEFERCGHSPWIEEHAHEAFSSTLRSWLLRHAS